MTNDSSGETRKQREALTKQALADVLRLSISTQRVHQTKVARASGVSRSFIRAILRAEKGCSLALFVELCHGLAADPCEVLRSVLDRRDELRGLSQGSVQ